MAENKQTLADYIISNMETKPNAYNKDPEAFTNRMNDQLNKMFGRQTTADDWPYKNTEKDNVSVKIARGTVDKQDRLVLNLEAHDTRTGELISNEWKRRWEQNEGGGLDIYNHTLKKKPEYSGDVKIGDVVNKGQMEVINGLNAEQGENRNYMSVCAQSGGSMIGGYHWANKGFSFKNEEELNKTRNNFKKFAEERGVNLSEEDMQLFTEPCHFAAFDTGTKGELKTDKAFALTPTQLETGSLSGVEGEMPLTPEEIENGAANRLAVHLGKEYMASQGEWKGISKENEPNSEVMKFAAKYKEAKTEAYQVLNNKFKEMMNKTKEAVSKSQLLGKLSGRTKEEPAENKTTEPPKREITNDQILAAKKAKDQSKR